MDKSSPDIVYRSTRSVKVGELERYVITYEPPQEEDWNIRSSSLWLKVKNTESVALRAAFLRGPYILYVDVRPSDYHHSRATFITAEQPTYQPNLSPNQSYTVELSMHTIKDKYVWIVDVISQVIFSPSTKVSFEVLVGKSKESLDVHCEKVGTFDPQLIVNRKNTLDLWNQPYYKPSIPSQHLVILTYGLHGNLGADMFYIKEQLDSIAAKTGEPLLVRGYPDNVCRTEKGIRYLGSRLGKYIVKTLYHLTVTKISFIGHSLGGLVQTFAIAYIEINYPWFFEKVQPINFITLASPLLGIVTDNPAYIQAALMVGVVGRTGQDLGLQSINSEEPLLKLLPTGPSHKILKRFRNRTLYANAINDGIVPLYTSALLYLDWKGLSKVSTTQKTKNSSTEDSSTNEETGKIPSDKSSKINPAEKPQEGEEDDFLTKTTKSIINPLQKAISLWAPNSQQSPSKNDEGEVDDRNSRFPKASMIESAGAVLLPPLPPTKFIVDPESRDDIIIHDRIYTEDDIPKKRVKKRSFIENLDPTSKFEDLEEEIAREWHKGMNWRKVLVKLEPDAHNNIFVRRRFANAFGWPVIDHLIENHFSHVFKDDEINVGVHSGNSTDDVENLQEFTDLTNKDDLDNELDLGDDKDDVNKMSHWVNGKDDKTVFDVGPTGMITNMNEIFDSFKNWKIVSPFDIPEDTPTERTFKDLNS